MRPTPLIPPDAAEAEIKDSSSVCGVPLIAREHETADDQAPPPCHGLCGCQVRSERRFVLVPLEAVVMGESVRGHFLARAGGDQVDERPG